MAQSNRKVSILSLTHMHSKGVVAARETASRSGVGDAARGSRRQIEFAGEALLGRDLDLRGLGRCLGEGILGGMVRLRGGWVGVLDEALRFSLTCSR
jgi:hypothetical protein